jgi:peptide/nickel transport system substrate-binding protein
MSDPPLDPDVFYQPEGLLIMTSAYQGLLRYVPESTKLPFDSAAAKTSFQRRIDKAAGPSYILADVNDVQTPDPQTFVVTLTTPSHRSSTTWPHRMDR